MRGPIVALLFLVGSVSCGSQSEGDGARDAAAGAERGIREIGPRADALPPEDLGWVFVEPPACRDLPACCDMLAPGDQASCRGTVATRDEAMCRSILLRQRVEGTCSSPAQIGPICMMMLDCCQLQQEGQLKDICLAQARAGFEDNCTMRLDALRQSDLCTPRDAGTAGDGALDAGAASSG